MEDICQCPICFESFCLTRKPLIFPCGHTICDPCVSDILSAQKPCPICMSPIPSDKNLFIVNYSLIPEQLPQKQVLDYSNYTKKLIQEIKFFEEMNKTLATLHDECSEHIRKTDNEINLCFKSFEIYFEKLKLTVKDRNSRLIEYNNEKISKHKKEIFDLVEPRKKVLKNIMEAQRRGLQIGVDTLFELDMLLVVKPIEVILRISDFKYQLNGDIFKIEEGLLQRFQVFENPYEFIIENLNSYEANNKIDGDKRNSNEHEQRRNAERRDFVVNQEVDIVKSKNGARLDPKFNYIWFIEYRDRQERLPDFALGQIERCRKNGRNRIRIFREGKVQYIADLNSMEYFKLDAQERIIPNQTVRLTCSSYY